jgi:AcrR family transcriptional regulator
MPAGNGQRGQPLAQAEIVKAALWLIRRSGLDGFTMRDLAQRLGVTVGATYNHVGSKDDLLRLVVDKLMSEVEAVDEPEGEPLELVRAMLLRAHARFSAYPGLAAYLTADDRASPGVAHLATTVAAALTAAGFTTAETEEAMRVLFFYTAGTLVLSVPRAESSQVAARHFAGGLGIILAGLNRQLSTAEGPDQERQGRTPTTRRRGRHAQTTTTRSITVRSGGTFRVVQRQRARG